MGHPAATARSAIVLSTSALALMATAPAHAQDQVPPAEQAPPAADAFEGEIVVTAQKRSENLQDVPLAVSAVGGAALDRLGVKDPLALSATVPNLSMQNNSGATYIYLRGVGSNFLGLGIDSSVAYHANGVYIARPRTQVASYFDVDRIEVVRGPQGDLYGRNATGGSINVITRKPTNEMSGYGTLTIGNYGLVQGEFGLGGPVIADKIKARVAGFIVDRGGYGKNEISGRDIDTRKQIATRATIVLDPTERLNIELIGDYYHQDDSAGVVHQGGRGRADTPTISERLNNTPTNIRNIVSTFEPNRFIRSWGVQGTLNYDLDSDWSFRSITAYRKNRYTSADDLLGLAPTTTVLRTLEAQNQFSQEVQVLGDGNGWDLILGGYYFTESVSGINGAPLPFGPGAMFLQQGEGSTRAYAGFAHGSIEIIDKLKLILGARYGYEKRTSTGSFTQGFTVFPTGGSKSFTSFTPKVVLQYEPTRNITVYGGVSKGNKSGGFTIGVPGPGTEPEELTSYEAGLKVQALNRRLTANLAAFYYDYTNLVVTRIVGAATIDENAAAATIKGVEAEITARPIDNLRFDMTVGLLDPKYKNYFTADPTRAELGVLDLSGKRLPSSSKYTARLGALYDIPLSNGGRISISGDAVLNGDIYFSSYETKNAYQPAVQTYNAALTYDSGKFWSATLWGRNLTNETIFSNQLVSASFWGYPTLTYLREPRTYGVDLRVKF